ncbi:MAG: hypothetical protein MI757_15560 [Pirellulales bacterium]|nr:hypothetical protein [Pirellulales bacterium]
MTHSLIPLTDPLMNHYDRTLTVFSDPHGRDSRKPKRMLNLGDDVCASTRISLGMRLFPVDSYAEMM